MFKQQNIFPVNCSCCLAIALLKDVEFTGGSCLVLPYALSREGHSFLCLVRAV